MNIERGVPALCAEPAADKDHDRAAEHLECLKIALNLLTLCAFKVLGNKSCADDLKDTDTRAEHAAQNDDSGERAHESRPDTADKEENDRNNGERLFGDDLHELAHQQSDDHYNNAGDGDEANLNVGHGHLRELCRDNAERAGDADNAHHQNSDQIYADLNLAFRFFHVCESPTILNFVSDSVGRDPLLTLYISGFLFIISSSFPPVKRCRIARFL